MSFQFYDPANIEFGVCRGGLEDAQFVMIPVDDSVRRMLEQMVLATREALGLHAADAVIEKYELSEQYPSSTPVALPIDDPLAETIRTLYRYQNIPTNATALDEVSGISAYFVIVHDQTGSKLLALKRAAQFKGMLKRRLIRFFDETLHAVAEPVFQLDSDFDLLVADETVYILRPLAFEQLAEIDEEVLDQAARNTAALDASVPGIKFSGIAPYVSTHKTAARIIASLLRRGDLADISIPNLRRECRRNDIPIDSVDGQLLPKKGQELAFLRLLDRRRYVISLIAGKWEQYEAGSRKGIGVRERAPGREVEPATPSVKPRQRTRNAKTLRAS